MPGATTGATTAAATAVIAGREAWIGALRDTLCGLAGAAAPPRQLLLWSTDFAEWPLDEAPVLDALASWLRTAGHHLSFIGHDYAVTARRHPRLARWRRDWSHRIEAWTPTVPIEREPAGLLLAGSRAVQLLDAVHWRARVLADTPSVQAWQEHSDACLQRCEPAWPATTLGL